MPNTIRRRSLAEAVLLLVALALAGSDGPWIPWPNLAGVGCFLLFAALAARPERGDA